MGNPYTSVSATGYNTSPPPDDGTTGANNEITWAGIKSKLADPLKTEIDTVNSNVQTAFGKIFGNNVSAISTAYSVVTGDQGKLLSCTGTNTITLVPAGTASANFTVGVLNAGSGTITVDGNGAETIDGALTIALGAGQFAILVCDGSNWSSFSNRSPVLRRFRSGLMLSSDATTPNTKVDISAGQATDDTNVALIKSSSTLIIDCTTTGANGLDTGALVASTNYHAFVIAKLDGTVAAFASTNLSPTLPTGYVFKRSLGDFQTDGSVHIITIGPRHRVFTVGGTFVTPAETDADTIFKFTVVGAGGGGGGANGGGGNQVGGSAGAGATAIYYGSGIAAGTNVTITVGTAGTAGSSAPGTGGTGGASTCVFNGVTVTAGGGIGGNAGATGSPTSGGAGGTATNGAINIPGGNGGSGSTAAGGVTSAPGGASTFGGGGTGVSTANPGVAGSAYGSGGSGAAVASGNGASVGGAGAPGIVIIEWT